MRRALEAWLPWIGRWRREAQVLVELQSLRAEVAAIRADAKLQMAATAAAQVRAADVLDRWDSDGLPERRAT